MQSIFKILKGLFIIFLSLFNVISSYATDDIVEGADVEQRTQVYQSNQHNLQIKPESPFDFLPVELKLNILSFLTLEELNVTAKINKKWFGLITNHNFLSSIFNKALERIREVVNDDSSASQEESFIEYVQEYWDILHNWLSLTAYDKSLEDKSFPLYFLQAFLSFSRASPTILKDLSTIRINHYANIENDLKKIFILGIYEKEFLFDSFPPEHRQDFIERCFTTPRDFILRIKAFQNHRFSLVPAHTEEDDQTKIRKSCLRLSSEKINILVKYASFGLFEIRANYHGEDEIIEACLKLTPQQMEERFKAIHKHAESVFTNNEDIYERSNIIACFLKLDEQQIDAITKYLPFLSDYEKGVDLYSTFHGTRIKTIQAYSTLTPEQMHAVGRHASLLFTAKMKIEEKRAVIKGLHQTYT